MTLKKLPEYISTLISAIEKLGRTEETTESRPVDGYDGIYERQAAGNAKSEDGTSKVAYGIPTSDVHKGDETIVPITGDCSVFFIGTKGVKTVKDVTAKVKAFVAYAKDKLGMNEVQAVTFFIERKNHAWNITQRGAFRPQQSGATGSKAVTDIMRQGIKAGLDPKLLEAKAAEIVKSLLEEAKSA